MAVSSSGAAAHTMLARYSAGGLIGWLECLIGG